jgi:hypothetical protein
MGSKGGYMFKTKRHVKPKKVFQVYILRRVGTGWELTNGSVKFQGNNRVTLLELMDQWETEAREALKASKAAPPRTRRSPKKSPKAKKARTKNPRKS